METWQVLMPSLFYIAIPFSGIRKMPTFVKIRYRYSALVIKTKRTIWVKKGRIQTEERTVPAKSAYRRRRKGVGCRRAFTVF